MAALPAWNPSPSSAWLDAEWRVPLRREAEGVRCLEVGEVVRWPQTAEVGDLEALELGQ